MTWSTQPREILVCVAGPSDTEPERECIKEAIHRLDDIFAQNKIDLRIRYMGWDTLLPQASGDGVQEMILNRLPWTTCDLVIGVFWKKFGKAGRDGLAPTESEIRRVYQACCDNGKPYLAIYFKKEFWKPETVEETSDHGKLLEFRTEIKDNILFREFHSTSDFAAEVPFLLIDKALRIQFERSATPNSAICQFRVAATPTTVCAEGVAEPASEICVEIDNLPEVADATIDLVVALNVTITNPWSQPQSHVIARVDGGGSAVAERRALNSLAFSRLSLPRFDRRRVVVRVQGIRVNACQLGVPDAGSFPQTTVTATVEVRSRSLRGVHFIGNPSTANIAIPILGLVCTGPKAGSNISETRQGANPARPPSLPSEPIEACGELTLREGFRGAFRSVSEGESNGTRFIASFFSIPRGVRLFVSADILLSHPSEVVGQPGGRLIDGAGANGGGGRLRNAYRQHELVADPQGRQFAEVGVFNGFAFAVWEWMLAYDEDGTDELGRVASLAFAISLDPDNPPAVGHFQVSLSLAPVSTVLSPSVVEPIPRFLDCVSAPRSAAFIFNDSWMARAEQESTESDANDLRDVQ